MPRARLYSPTARAADGSVLQVVDRHAAPNAKGVYPPLVSADGVPVTLTLMGADSPAARRLTYLARAEQQNRIVTRVRGGDGTPGVTVEDIEEQETRDIEKCATLLRAWTGVTEADGSPSPCTRDAARELFRDDEDLRLQALDFVEDRVRFFGHSSTPSGGTASTSSV